MYLQQPWELVQTNMMLGQEMDASIDINQQTASLASLCQQEAYDERHTTFHLACQLELEMESSKSAAGLKGSQ